MKKVIYLLLATVIVLTVCCIVGGWNSRELYRINRDYYSIIQQQDDLLNQAAEIIRELQLKNDFLEDVTEGRINITVKPREAQIR